MWPTPPPLFPCFQYIPPRGCLSYSAPCGMQLGQLFPNPCAIVLHTYKKNMALVLG